MATHRQKPLLLGPYPVTHRTSRRRCLVAATALGLIAVGMFALLAWRRWQPQLARQAAGIPSRVHVMLRTHHATYTPITDISPAMQHAIVAIEDRRFYQHHGIDLHAIARAFFADITSRHFDQGGATLTEQLVEDTIPLQGNIVQRSLNILGLAWVTEEHFRKPQILELYLNAVYYGRGAYGIATAAQTYFHQSPASLDVAQAAFLAALPQAPTAYGNHPFGPAMQARWHTVIRDMAAQGYITRPQEQAALHERLRLAGLAAA
jgi:membrane peptidoglycan carboxypeptidase